MPKPQIDRLKTYWSLLDELKYDSEEEDLETDEELDKAIRLLEQIRYDLNLQKLKEQSVKEPSARIEAQKEG